MINPGGVGLTLAFRKARTIFNYILITAVGLFFLVPIFWMVTTSLKPDSEILSTLFFGSKLVWGNYSEAMNYLPFGRFYLNSTFVAFSVTFLVLLTSSLSAYAFARITFPARDKLFLLYLATLMIPGQLTIVPLFIIMKTFGWIDTYYSLILPAAFTAFGTFLLRQFFLTIPSELEDAARMDGCKRLGIYWHVILPLSKPALATLAVFTFVGQWNNFLWPLIVTNTTAKFVIPLGIMNFQGQHGTEWNLLMAAATVSIIPGVILFLFVQRYLVEGITMTGMGGK
jgi:multiple sugar transport system permease protein